VKLLILGDMHWRYNAPVNRIDDFFSTQLKKTREALDIGAKEGCQYALQPGDLWDNPHPAKFVMSTYISLLRDYDMKLMCVVGQHDMTMRNFAYVDRTATHLLSKAGVVQVVGLDKSPVMLGSDKDGEVWLHGLSYEQDHEPKAKLSALNILLAHVSVGDKPLYPDHDLTKPQAFAAKHNDMDLIVVGDYHYTFVVEVGEQLVVNAGCLVRKTTAERDLIHEPCVFTYNTETGEYGRHVLKSTKPWEEVFVIPNRDSGKTDRLLEFVEMLREDRRLSVSFAENLRLHFKKNKTRKRVREIVAEVMDRVGMPVEELRDGGKK